MQSKRSWVVLLAAAAAFVLLAGGSCCCWASGMIGSGASSVARDDRATATPDVGSTLPRPPAMDDALPAAAEAQDRATQAAADLVRDEVTVRAALDEIGTAIEQRRWSFARARLDAIAPRFEPILPVAFTLQPDASPDARATVATVTELRRIFLEHRAAIDGDHRIPLDPEDRRIGLICFRTLAEEAIAGGGGPDVEAEERRAMARCAREAGVSRARADRAYEAWAAAGMPGAASVRPGR